MRVGQNTKLSVEGPAAFTGEGAGALGRRGDEAHSKAHSKEHSREGTSQPASGMRDGGPRSAGADSPLAAP